MVGSECFGDLVLVMWVDETTLVQMKMILRQKDLLRTREVCQEVVVGRWMSVITHSSLSLGRNRDQSSYHCKIDLEQFRIARGYPVLRVLDLADLVLCDK